MQSTQVRFHLLVREGDSFLVLDVLIFLHLTGLQIERSQDGLSHLGSSAPQVLEELPEPLVALRQTCIVVGCEGALQAVLFAEVVGVEGFDLDAGRLLPVAVEEVGHHLRS